MRCGEVGGAGGQDAAALGQAGPLPVGAAGAVDRRFNCLSLTTTPDGTVTLDDGLAHFDTTIHEELRAGDHTIVLLRLHAVHNGGHAMPSPLVFHRSRFGRPREE